MDFKAAHVLACPCGRYCFYKDGRSYVAVLHKYGDVPPGRFVQYRGPPLAWSEKEEVWSDAPHGMPDGDVWSRKGPFALVSARFPSQASGIHQTNRCSRRKKLPK